MLKASATGQKQQHQTEENIRVSSFDSQIEYNNKLQSVDEEES